MNNLLKMTKNKWIAAAAAVVALLLVNMAIYQKEMHLKHGQSIYLALAPVDPRSLMQGDYMRLDYALNGQIREKLKQEQQSGTGENRAGEHKKRHHFPPRNLDGKAILSVNEQGIASFSRLYQPNSKLAKNEVLMAYRVRNHRVKIASNAFFFEEGSASRYEEAKYAKVMLNSKGEPLLKDLLDADLQRITPVTLQEK